MTGPLTGILNVILNGENVDPHLKALRAITQVIVPWWVIPLILVILSAVAWFLAPPWLERKIQDPDEWWDNKRMEALMVLAEGHETRNRMGAIRTAFMIHYSTLHDCAWMDRVKMLEALDETAEVVKILLQEDEHP